MDEQMTYTSSMQSAQAPQQLRRNVVVCDDEREIADLVASLLEREGFNAQATYCAQDALALVHGGQVDCAILDIMMPGMDGFELGRRIREFSDIPLIFLSAKDEEVDKVLGFALGADDYVTKPFKPRELVMRVRACLRRFSRAEQTSNDDERLSMRGIEMCPDSHEAWLLDVPLSLTPKEFSLLEALLRAGGSPVSTGELYEKAWGEPADPAGMNTVMVHVRHLRKKLAEVDASTLYVETVWGMGYRIAKAANERR
jgi:two-component system response regulator VanR